MKKLLLVLALGVVVTSCKKEDITPVQEECRCDVQYTREKLVHHTELPTMPYTWDTLYSEITLNALCKDTFEYRFIINTPMQQIRERQRCIN